MNVVFRVDASPRIGGGHLMRCLTLADALADRAVKTTFVCREGAGEFIASLAPTGMQFSFLPSSDNGEGVREAEDARQILEFIESANPEWLILDHYGLGIEWERSLRPLVGRLMVIDDYPHRRHDCDALLDQNLAAGGTDRYEGLVPRDCYLMVGPQFALLRREFLIAREKLARRRDVLRRIVIFFTSGDDQGETVKAMLGIERFDRTLEVDVVAGVFTSCGKEIANKCKTLGWRFHHQVANMAELMSNADLAIGASGSTSWERCVLGVPALVTILAENQSAIGIALDKAGAAVCLGWHRETTPDTYAQALRNLSGRKLSEMSEIASSLVDGLGASRVSDFLTSLRSSRRWAAH